MVGVAVLFAAAAGDALTTHETPRATDLLRAQKLAEQAEKRLRLPAKHGPGWQRGGGGWNAGERAPEAPAPGSVTIKVQPPRRRTRRE
jgi:hypothetical protein